MSDSLKWDRVRDVNIENRFLQLFADELRQRIQQMSHKASSAVYWPGFPSIEHLSQNFTNHAQERLTPLTNSMQRFVVKCKGAEMTFTTRS